MNLHTLDASNNNRITDEGIKKLHKLYSWNNRGITKQQTKE